MDKCPLGHRANTRLAQLIKIQGFAGQHERAMPAKDFPAIAQQMFLLPVVARGAKLKTAGKKIFVSKHPALLVTKL